MMRYLVALTLFGSGVMLVSHAVGTPGQQPMAALLGGLCLGIWHNMALGDR